MSTPSTEIVRQQQRRDTSANWAAWNPILRAGEHGYDTTLKREKVGDGVTVWLNLDWADSGGGGGGGDTTQAVKFAVYSSGAWPARPAGGTAVQVIWLDSLAASSTDPVGPLAGDLLIKGAVT